MKSLVLYQNVLELPDGSTDGRLADSVCFPDVFEGSVLSPIHQNEKESVFETKFWGSAKDADAVSEGVDHQVEGWFAHAREALELFGRVVQMDVVIGEILLSEPEVETIPLLSGGSVEIFAASVAQSLAWKCLWLATDQYPEAKDVYDAVLLAEKRVRDGAPLDVALLDLTLESNWENHDGFDREKILSLDVNWDDFRREFPSLADRVDPVNDGLLWLSRLADALEPTFAQRKR